MTLKAILEFVFNTFDVNQRHRWIDDNRYKNNKSYHGGRTFDLFDEAWIGLFEVLCSWTIGQI